MGTYNPTTLYPFTQLPLAMGCYTDARYTHNDVVVDIVNSFLPLGPGEKAQPENHLRLVNWFNYDSDTPAIYLTNRYDIDKNGLKVGEEGARPVAIQLSEANLATKHVSALKVIHIAVGALTVGFLAENPVALK